MNDRTSRTGSKCRTCRQPAIIDLPRHNANFCAEHFLELCRRQVTKAIERFDMLTADDRILVAVSGGKDSLAVWDLLLELGYRADGLYVGLGIGDYSDVSGAVRRDAFAADRGLHLHRDLASRRVRVRHPDGVARRRAACRARRAGSASGTCSTRPPSTVGTPRWSPATTSTTRRRCCWATRCAGRSTTWPVSCPCSPARDGFPKKVKPLVRLTERETAAWCVVRGIDYLVDECPMAAGNKHLGYKATLNALEAAVAGFEGGVLPELRRADGAVAGGSPARRARGIGSVQRMRCADVGRRVRLLPPGRHGQRARAGADRTDHANSR